MSKFRKAIISILISLLTLGFGTCVNASSIDFTDWLSTFESTGVQFSNVGDSTSTSRNYDYGELIYSYGALNFDKYIVKGEVDHFLKGTSIHFINYKYDRVNVTCYFKKNGKTVKTITCSVPSRRKKAEYYVKPNWTYKIINVGDTVSLYVSTNTDWSMTKAQGAITATRSGNSVNIKGTSEGYGFFSIYASGMQSTLIGVTVKGTSSGTTTTTNSSASGSGSSSTSSGSSQSTYVPPADTPARRWSS